MNPLNHVAIIMDGNGRWGLKNRKSRNEGHKSGLDTVEKIIKETIKQKINYLTLYAFSTTPPSTCIISFAAFMRTPIVKYDARAVQWLSATHGSLSNTGCQLQSTSERERDGESRSHFSARPPANQVPLIQKLGSFDP